MLAWRPQCLATFASKNRGIRANEFEALKITKSVQSVPMLVTVAHFPLVSLLSTPKSKLNRVDLAMERYLAT
jgi:hypothetical protein